MTRPAVVAVVALAFAVLICGGSAESPTLFKFTAKEPKNLQEVEAQLRMKEAEADRWEASLQAENAKIQADMRAKSNERHEMAEVVSSGNGKREIVGASPVVARRGSDGKMYYVPKAPSLPETRPGDPPLANSMEEYGQPQFRAPARAVPQPTKHYMRPGKRIVGANAPHGVKSAGSAHKSWSGKVNVRNSDMLEAKNIANSLRPELPPEEPGDAPFAVLKSGSDLAATKFREKNLGSVYERVPGEAMPPQGYIAVGTHIPGVPKAFTEKPHAPKPVAVRPAPHRAMAPPTRVNNHFSLKMGKRVESASATLTEMPPHLSTVPNADVTKVSHMSSYSAAPGGPKPMPAAELAALLRAANVTPMKLPAEKSYAQERYDREHPKPMPPSVLAKLLKEAKMAEAEEAKKLHVRPAPVAPIRAPIVEAVKAPSHPAAAMPETVIAAERSIPTSPGVMKNKKLSQRRVAAVKALKDYLDAIKKTTAPRAAMRGAQARFLLPQSMQMTELSQQGEVLCNNGAGQSPIDLKVQGGDMKPFKERVDFNYAPVNDLTLHHLLTNLAVTFAKSPGTLTYAGTTYMLQECHFLSPSAHTIDDFHYEMELQCTHVGSKDGKAAYAVSAFLIKADDNYPPNEYFSNLFLEFPVGPGNMKVHTEFDMRGLMSELSSDPAFFHYSGSLSSPPCIEGVEYFVFRKPLHTTTVDRNIILKSIGPNNRPTQPLHGRVVEMWDPSTVEFNPQPTPSATPQAKIVHQKPSVPVPAKSPKENAPPKANAAPEGTPAAPAATGPVAHPLHSVEASETTSASMAEAIEASPQVPLPTSSVAPAPAAPHVQESQPGLEKYAKPIGQEAQDQQ